MTGPDHRSRTKIRVARSRRVCYPAATPPICRHLFFSSQHGCVFVLSVYTSHYLKMFQAQRLRSGCCLPSARTVTAPRPVRSPKIRAIWPDPAGLPHLGQAAFYQVRHRTGLEPVQPDIGRHTPPHHLPTGSRTYRAREYLQTQLAKPTPGGTDHPVLLPGCHNSRPQHFGAQRGIYSESSLV